MRVLAAFALAGALLSASDADADSRNRTSLVVLGPGGDRTVLGVMMSEGICDTVADRLNFYAQLPPADADRFYCRSPY